MKFGVGLRAVVFCSVLMFVLSFGVVPVDTAYAASNGDRVELTLRTGKKLKGVLVNKDGGKVRVKISETETMVLPASLVSKIKVLASTPKPTPTKTPPKPIPVKKAKVTPAKKITPKKTTPAKPTTVVRKKTTTEPEKKTSPEKQNNMVLKPPPEIKEETGAEQAVRLTVQSTASILGGAIGGAAGVALGLGIACDWKIDELCLQLGNEDTFLPPALIGGAIGYPLASSLSTWGAGKAFSGNGSYVGSLLGSALGAGVTYLLMQNWEDFSLLIFGLPALGAVLGYEITNSTGNETSEPGEDEAALHWHVFPSQRGVRFGLSVLF